MDPIKFKKAFESSPNTLFNNPDSVNEVFRQTGVDFQTQEILDNYLSENKISLDSFGLSEADSVDEKKILLLLFRLKIQILRDHSSLVRKKMVHRILKVLYRQFQPLFPITEIMKIKE